MLLRPKLELAQTSALTLAIGLALRDAVSQRIAPSAEIKWPNDLLVNGKKLAGVLVESQLQGDRLQALVVGIGLNVASREFPEEIAARATSLALLGAARLERELLLEDILEAIAARLEAYQSDRCRGHLERAQHDGRAARKRVRVDDQIGIGRGLDEQGRLLLEDDSGSVHAISSGTVELL